VKVGCSSNCGALGGPPNDAPNAGLYEGIDVNEHGDEKKKAPRARRRRTRAEAVAQKPQDAGFVMPAPIASKPVGDGSLADAVWAGVTPEEIELEARAAESAGTAPEAVEIGESDGEPPAEDTAADETGTSGQGRQDQAAKRKVSKNSLQDGFFAQQYHTIVGDDPLDVDVFQRYLEGTIDTYHPVAFVDKERVRRLALLYFKRGEILERAESGERRRSVLRHRRSVRFAPVMSIDELMDKDRPAIMRRSDGVAYVIAVLEGTLQSVEAATTSAAAVEAVELFEHWFGAVLQPWEQKIAPSMPGLQHPNVPTTAPEELLAWLRCRLQALQVEESRLRDEEAKLATAEEARRGVPHGKHFEKIARAAREVNREIRRLEWDLAPLRGWGPGRPRGR